jgi:hypothetical protein
LFEAGHLCPECKHDTLGFFGTTFLD